MTFKMLGHGFNLQTVEKRLSEVIPDWIGVKIGALSERFSKDLSPSAAAREAAAENGQAATLRRKMKRLNIAPSEKQGLL